MESLPNSRGRYEAHRATVALCGGAACKAPFEGKWAQELRVLGHFACAAWSGIRLGGAARAAADRPRDL
eukprot:11297302-Alexandrium_andersonii.AAC.1